MPLELIQTLSGHCDRVWTLAWNPSGTILASSGSDKTIRLWARDKNEWKCVSILTETHNKSIRRICWSPCGQYLASASFDSTVCIWRRNSSDGTWVIVVNLEGHENEVKSVAWSHDGNYLASCGRDRTVWIWERETADDEETSQEDSAENWDCSDVKNDHTKDVKHILWHPRQNILVSCSYDDTIKFFNKIGDDWKCYETLASHSSTVWSADFSPTGEFLATCSDDRTVRIWKNYRHEALPTVEQNSWKCISVIQGYHSRTIYDISWSIINNVIVSASGDNSLVIYAPSNDSTAADELYVCVDKKSLAHECDINSVTWNNTIPGLLASGSDDCSIKIWNYSETEKGMRPLTVIDEILKNLSIGAGSKSQISENPSHITKNVTDFSNLLNLLQSLQHLQSEMFHDDEATQLMKLFDLNLIDDNPKPLQLSEIQFTTDGSTEGFSINVVDTKGDIKYKFNISIQSTFKLIIPRRSSNLLTVANEIFLFEKTGDLYSILQNGTSQFLLGHLFMFSDVKFIIPKNSQAKSYIISADRDEKIRLTNYPKTFEIERYCFGHKHFIKRLILVDHLRFLSIDNQGTVCLWDLKNLDKSTCQQSMIPEKILTLEGNAKKRFCRDTDLSSINFSS